MNKFEKCKEHKETTAFFCVQCGKWSDQDFCQNCKVFLKQSKVIICVKSGLIFPEECPKKKEK